MIFFGSHLVASFYASHFMVRFVGHSIKFGGHSMKIGGNFFGGHFWAVRFMSVYSLSSIECDFSLYFSI